MAIDVTKPLELSDGRKASFCSQDTDGDINVKVAGERALIRSFTPSGRHRYGELPSLRNVRSVLLGCDRCDHAGYANCDCPPDRADATVNPKELAGSRKPATWSVMPRWVSLAVGRVMSVGAAKYGAFNYRDSRIAASTYQDAMERHAALWFDGEDNDPETGVSHLASIIASCSLLMDAQASGKLTDDRQKTGRVRGVLEGLESLLVSLPLPFKKAA